MSRKRGRGEKVLSGSNRKTRGASAGAQSRYYYEEHFKRKAARKNPTKAQKREKAKRTAAKRRIAKALQNFVRKANPAAKGVVKATKVKGGWNVRVVDVRRAK